MRVIVGLGNPGRRYRGTRHNLGRDVVERLAADLGVRLAEDGWVRTARARIGAAAVVLAIPETYMNVSGQAVRDLLRRRRRRASDLLVIHDDLDLPLGQLRLKPGNGPGGHNGIRSIIETLGSDRFARLRIGIGRPPAGVDPTEFVLERFTAEERPVTDTAIARAAEAVRAVVSEGLPAAMNHYNARTPSGKAATAP
jgi:peptidyl-tRNA hydrolase, PTH1 family